MVAVRNTRKHRKQRKTRKQRKQRGGAPWSITGDTALYNVWTNPDFPSVHISQTKANLADFHSTRNNCHYNPAWHPGAHNPYLVGFVGSADECTEAVRVSLMAAYHDFKDTMFPKPKALPFGKPWGNYGEY